MASAKTNRAVRQFALWLGVAALPWIMALALGGVDNAIESRGWILAALASPAALYGAAVWAVRFFQARGEPQD